MSIDKDGGPAFPHIPTYGSVDGMSLRDYIAIKAMAALMHDMGNAYKVAEKRGIKVRDAISIAAYEQSDAMLAARERKS